MTVSHKVVEHRLLIALFLKAVVSSDDKRVALLKERNLLRHRKGVPPLEKQSQNEELRDSVQGIDSEKLLVVKHSEGTGQSC